MSDKDNSMNNNNQTSLSAKMGDTTHSGSQSAIDANHAAGPSAPPQNAANPATGDDDYQVGYCCPPKHTQFKKGEPSPRKGKKKNKTDFEAAFDKIANEKISVRTGGVTKTITRVEACLLKRMDLALSGNLPALKDILREWSIRSAVKLGEEIRAENKTLRHSLFQEFMEIEAAEKEEQAAKKREKTQAYNPFPPPKSPVTKE